MENLKIVLISLFGATAGQGVVWYTAILCALLPAIDPQRKRDIRKLHRRHACSWECVLRFLRLAERPRRPEMDNHGRALACSYMLASHTMRCNLPPLKGVYRSYFATRSGDWGDHLTPQKYDESYTEL